MSELLRLLAELIEKRNALELIKNPAPLDEADALKFADFIHNLMYAVATEVAPEMPPPVEEPNH